MRGRREDRQTERDERKEGQRFRGSEGQRVRGSEGQRFRGSGAEFRWYAEEDGLATHGTLVTVGSAALGLHAEAGATELMSTSHHHLVGIT